MRTTIAALAVLIGLCGCAADSPDAATSPDEPTTTPTVNETAAAVSERFAMPSSCADVLPGSRLSQFASEGLVLLGGPDGLYGDEYLADPSPEQRVGGITCIWGPPDTEVSDVTVSVAPLSAEARPAIVSDLATNQGLNETVEGGVTLYWLLGDREHQPAILNVLSADSWVSIIETIGGTDAYAEAETLAAEVHELVYRPS